MTHDCAACRIEPVPDQCVEAGTNLVNLMKLMTPKSDGELILDFDEAGALWAVVVLGLAYVAAVVWLVFRRPSGKSR
jgi:hypothetical protein